MAARSDAVPAATMARMPALRRLVDLEDGLDDGFFAAAQRTLRELIADPALLAALPPPDAGGFGRRLLYTDPNERFGIWALTWPPGWRTPVHNHHCACAFAVCRGRIEEVLYAAGPGAGALEETVRALRPPGYVGGAARKSGIVHGMGNASADMALSIHLYAYQPDRHADSIDRCFDIRTESQEHR